MLAAGDGCIATVEPVQFSTDPATCDVLEGAQGTFPPSAPCARTGTTVLIEDVAFPASRSLGRLDLQALLRPPRLPRGDHFRPRAGRQPALRDRSRDFGDQAEIDRARLHGRRLYRSGGQKYDGSLKARHGTGRNMAPFVEMEWGKKRPT